MKSFPKPLSAEKERYYLLQYTEGNLEAKHILIEHNLRLVAHVLKKYQYLDEDSDDMISIGTIGLIKAVTTFDPNKGNRLATYAAKCIENEILMMLRSKKKFAKEVSIYEPIGTDHDGNEIQIFDVVESKEDTAYEQILLRENIKSLYKHIEHQLSPREQTVLKMRYGLYHGHEYTQREIAARLHISRSYVSRIEKSAIDKLRFNFNSST